MYTFLPLTIIWRHKTPCALQCSPHSCHINMELCIMVMTLSFSPWQWSGVHSIYTALFIVLLRAPHRVFRTLLSMPFLYQHMALSFVNLPRSKHDQIHHHSPRHCGGEQHKHRPPKVLGVRLHYILTASVSRTASAR